MSESPKSDLRTIWPLDYEELSIRLLEFSRTQYDQLLWCENRKPPEEFTSTEFFEEYVWVVMVSGFNAYAVQQVLRRVREAIRMKVFEPISMYDLRRQLEPKFLKVFGNKRKVTAIFDVAGMIEKYGWETFSEKYLTSTQAMRQLPFIGPVTQYHLARNLGYDVVKPDLHLERISKYYGTPSPRDLCLKIQELVPWRLGTVDLMLFLYALKYKTTELQFQEDEG